MRVQGKDFLADHDLSVTRNDQDIANWAVLHSTSLKRRFKRITIC